MTYWNIRQTDDRKARVEQVERLTGLSGVTAVIDYALAYTLANHTQEAEMNENQQAATLAEVIEFVVDNGRIELGTQEEFEDEVRFELSEREWSDGDIDAAMDDPMFPTFKDAEIALAASRIVDAAGGHLGECKDWLSDGDFDAGDDLSEYIEEWREIGATYQA
ncbi:MAG: hypothetical protein GF364_22785 [Candidatus Lokiarchaeota archaeon]|nr:hypothetical protein [Candidatus Lokiarchaeota archaeon]